VQSNQIYGLIQSTSNSGSTLTRPNQTHCQLILPAHDPIQPKWTQIFRTHFKPNPTSRSTKIWTVVHVSRPNPIQPNPWIDPIHIQLWVNRDRTQPNPPNNRPYPAKLSQPVALMVSWPPLKTDISDPFQTKPNRRVNPTRWQLRSRLTQPVFWPLRAAVCISPRRVRRSAAAVLNYLRSAIPRFKRTLHGGVGRKTQIAQITRRLYPVAQLPDQHVLCDHPTTGVPRILQWGGESWQCDYDIEN